MSGIEFGILGCLAMIVLLLLSVPVGFTLIITGGIGFALVMHNPLAAYHVLISVIFDTFSKYDYSVIPLFILMGQVSFHSGISKRLFDAAYVWLGRLPGGLGAATVGACAAFGAICGSGPATAATMAAVALPEMKKHHYSMQLATGTVAAGGSLGMLIPPSVVFIVYGFMTEQSPARLFVAGILPGIMLAVMFCAYIIWACWRNPKLGPPGPSSSWPAKFIALLGVIETLILFTLVMGGLFFGWFTPTEAAAVGALGSLAVAAARRRLSWNMLRRSLLETMRMSCMVLIIVAGALVFGRFLAVTRLPSLIASTLSTLPFPGWVIIGCILLFFILAGTVVDSLALVLMTIPIFLPVVKSLGCDLIWFGVMIVTVVQIGVISPPVGMNAYVVSGMMRDVPLQTVFRGCIPFIWVLLAGIALLMLFPQIALWLPGKM